MYYYEREFIPTPEPEPIPTGMQLIKKIEGSTDRSFSISDINCKRIFYRMDIVNFTNASLSNINIGAKFTYNNKTYNLPSKTTITIPQSKAGVVYGFIDCSDGILKGYSYAGIPNSYDRATNYLRGDIVSNNQLLSFVELDSIDNITIDCSASANPDVEIDLVVYGM